jgi:hypothetical protein
MNTNLIKNVSVFTAGAAIGALVTYMSLKTKYEVIIQEEIASIREYSDRQRAKQDVRVPHGYSQKDSLDNLVKRYNGDVEASNAMADPEDLEWIKANPNVLRRDEDKDYFEYEKVSRNANDGNRAIYVITTEQFNEERLEFDKSTISFYEDDETLADENEEIISDVVSVVGDALERFGEDSGDPEIVYVRNERMSIDYEVVRFSKSYKETVGI